MNTIDQPPEQNENTDSITWRKWFYDIFILLTAGDAVKAQNFLNVITLADKSPYGKVLASDVNGKVNWADIYYNASTLSVGLNAVLVVPTATATVIPFDIVSINQDSTVSTSYSTTTGKWTPPKKGKYWVSATVTYPQATMVANSQVSVAVFKNGTTYILAAAFDTGGAAADKSATVSGIVEANGTDYFEVLTYHTMGANKSPIPQTYVTYFHAYRFSA